MAFSGGTFTTTDGTRTGPNVFQAEQSAGIDILASNFDAVVDDIAAGLTNCITKNGQTTPTSDLPMGGYKFSGVGNAAARANFAAAGQVQDGSLMWGGAAGGTGNAITLSLTPAITAYAAGQRFAFLASAANTTAVTLNVNSVGAADVKKINAAGTAVALAASDIRANMLVDVVYNGTAFLLVNPQTLIAPSGQVLVLGADGSAVVQVTGTSVIPSADNTYDLGGGSYTWKNVTAKKVTISGMPVWTGTPYSTIRTFDSTDPTNPVTISAGMHALATLISDLKSKGILG